jgi:hypothetical protein
MKSDRICWIDSRTIKRGHVLMLDGSLVPFCSKCLGAWMRANDALSSFEKEQVRELTAQARTVCSMRADDPLPLQKVWWKFHVAGGRCQTRGHRAGHVAKFKRLSPSYLLFILFISCLSRLNRR